ncbi:MAG: radical SAM protein [Candidatus Woesearchaeota archaeon]
MNKIFYLDINNSCNNNCRGCAVDPSTSINNYKEFSYIKKELLKGKTQGYNILHPVGGEPTLHPNLVKILSTANKIYDKIAITSNGRRFSYYSYAQKFKNLNVDFNISLGGPNEKIHDTWTNSKGSFNETIKGIKNIKHMNKKLCLNIILWKQSSKVLMDFIDLINEIQPNEIGILALGPFGRCKNKFMHLSPNLSDLLIINTFLRLAVNLVDDIDVEDFPLCLFEKDLIQNSKIHFQDISSSVYIGTDDKIETLGLFAANDLKYPINSLELNNSDFSDIINKISSYKQQLSTCKKCILNNRCKGVYKDYIIYYGSNKVNQELKKLKIINKLSDNII